MVSGSSVFLLVLIFLERAFALIWPLRNRVTSSKVYIYSVVIVWFAGIAIGAFSLLTVYGIFVVTNFVIAYSVVIVLSLFVICLRYLSIRKKLYSPNPAIDKGDSRKRVEQSTKLSKTIFFMIDKQDIVHHQNFRTKFVSKVCYFHFIYVACVVIALEWWSSRRL